MGTESWLALAFGAALALAFDLAFPLAFALAFHDLTIRGWNIQWLTIWKFHSNFDQTSSWDGWYDMNWYDSVIWYKYKECLAPSLVMPAPGIATPTSGKLWLLPPKAEQKNMAWLVWASWNMKHLWQTLFDNLTMHIAYIIIIRTPTFTSRNMLSHLTLFCDAGLFIPPNAFQRWKTGIMEQYVIMTNQTSKHFETRRKVCVTPLGLKLNKKCVWFVICIHAYTDIYCVIYEKRTWYVRKTTVNT